jgi:hypothetical protein
MDDIEHLIEGQRHDRFPFTTLTREQRKILDDHANAAFRTSRNTDTIRDPLERKYLTEMATKIYAGLDMPTPTIYILDSPMACAFAWGHTPQTVADRWRVFHDEFYTHPLSQPITDIIQDQYNAVRRLVDHNITVGILPTLSAQYEARYDELGRVGDLIHTAITSVEKPFQNAELLKIFTSQVEKYIPNKSIQDSVRRQPLPNLDRLFLPGEIFRGNHFLTTAYYQSMSDLGLPFNGFHKNLIRLWHQMDKACHFWFPYKHSLIISDRPSVLHVDDRGRAHNPKGPAIEYRDGWKIYAWKDILIPRDIIEKPESITVTQILEEGNTEIRRVMVDVFGLDRFVVESKSKSLDKQGDYELLRVPYLNNVDMIALKMRCPTTAAVYVHSVHPECTNVEQALAWKRGEDNFFNARPYKEGLLWEK